MLHENGWGGLPQSYERAVELYKASAAQGNAGAHSNLGVQYVKGQGVAQSFAKARHHLELAAKGGDAPANHNLQQLAADIQQRCPLLGRRVVLRGLTNEAALKLNGTRGTAIDFGDGRYVVKRDGAEGRLVRVKPTNVEAAK